MNNIQLREALSTLMRELHAEFPDFRIKRKSESSLMRFLNALLLILTFGRMNVFMESFITTVGNTVYVGANWEGISVANRIIILSHERIHLRQRNRYGGPLFSFLYLFFPLPVLFSYYRRKFEMEAYEETMRVLTVTLPDSAAYILSSESYKSSLVGHFTGAEYFWMWPFKGSVSRWYDDTVEKLLSESPSE